MNEIPDVLGLELSEAKRILNSAGRSYLIERVSSYSRDKVEDGFPRVIRQIIDSEGNLVLTVANVRDIFLDEAGQQQ